MARPRQVSDEQILEAARACFLESGPSVATSVIADRLGVSQAALFKRFGSKEDLMVAALSPPPMQGWLDRVDTGPDDRPITVQLHSLAIELSEHFAYLVPCMSMLRASGIDPHAQWDDDDVPPPIRGRLALAGWIRRAQALGRIRDLDPDVLAMALMGSLQARAFTAHILASRPGDALIAPLMETETYVRGLIDALWNGARPLEAT